MKILVVLSVVCGVLAGCAAAPESQESAERPRSVCEREAPTGSNLPVTRCRSTAEREQDRERAQRNMDQMRSGAAGSGKGGTN